MGAHQYCQLTLPTSMLPKLVKASTVTVDNLKPANPVKVERDRLNAAAARVLAYLQRHGDATNVELCCPDVGGMRAVGRIHELRRDGHVISKEHLHGGVWRYRLERP